MIIQMVWQMSGGRYDDRSWPVPWTDFEVPDEEGRGLISCGAAMEVVGTVSPGAPSGPVRESVTPKPAASAPASAMSAAPDPKPESVFLKSAEPAAPKVSPPAPADPKAAWVDHAVSQGVAQAEAENMTKAQLQAAYGSRM